LLADRIRIRQGEWNAAVERLLLETLGESQEKASAEKPEVPATV
jgi:hypothetical protein